MESSGRSKQRITSDGKAEEHYITILPAATRTEPLIR